MRTAGGFGVGSIFDCTTTGKLLGSIVMKAIPIPALGRELATLPRAVTCAPAREILNRTFVPCGNGLNVSTKHPNRFRSLVCAASCFSDCTSVS